MESKTVKFLEQHQAEEPSRFEEKALERKTNATWLHWSQSVALRLVDYMQDNHLNRAELAERLGVSPQYVSRLLSGTINFSFKSIAEIENRLNVHCMGFPMG